MKASTDKVLRMILRGIVLIVVLGSAVVGGVVFDRKVLTAFVPLDNIPSHAIPDFRLMAEAWNTIHRYYVDRAGVKPHLLTYGSISGMVDALGDTGHSTFLTPEMVKKQSDFSKGKFKGIGAEVQMKEGHVVIVAPLDGSPAQEAGLRPGDIILQVNGEGISGLPLDQLVDRIAGPAGTKVSLTLLSPSTGQTRDVTLVRAEITIHNVTWSRLPGTDVAHVRIAGFSEDVTENLKTALRDIQQEKLTGLILDLRNDPGGLLDQAIGAASQFLTRGDVLIEKDAQGDETPTPVQPGGLAQSLPMVCLINQGTASAAEIVAGALKDAHRARLVGETTFGTGTVLREFPLSDGSTLLLAVEEWLTPSGHTIWHRGITPDVTVSLPQDVSPLTPGTERDMTPDQLRAGKDEQLLRALELVSHAGEEVTFEPAK